MKKHTYLAVNEHDVLRALTVTITGSVLSSSLVTGPSRHTTVRVHFDKVEGAILTAGELGPVHFDAGEALFCAPDFFQLTWGQL